MIQLANYEERTFYVVLGQIVTTCDVKFIFQMTEEEFDVTLTPVSSTERATKFVFTATGYPEGQYIVQFNVSGSTLATVAGFVTGNPIFATSQYNTYNDDGTSTTYVPSDDQGLVPSVSQKLRVSTVDLNTDVSYVRYLKVTNGTLTDNGDNSVTINTSGVDTLEALTDVYITNVENNQIIQYQSFSLPGNPAGWKNRVLQLASLNDTKGIPSDGQYLVYTGGFWQPYTLNLPSPPPSNTDSLPEGTTNLYYTEARVSANTDVAANTAKVGITAQQASDILNNNAKVSLIAGGTTGQALVKTSGTDYDVEWADISIDVQYHNRYATESETLRAGATATTELYYSAQADGDGLAESASSDTPTAGYDIRRKLYYSEAGFADPDTGTWTQFTAIADNTTFNTAKAALLAYLKERTGGTVPISLKMTWEEVAQAPSFTGLLNESYGSGAEAAYSTRRLNGNVTDCMVIRRASDSTTTTIGFDSNGNIDEAAINTFCSGTTCTVSEWKDQSGNGNDATQSDPTKQPTIYTGGALVKENGKVAVNYGTTSDSYYLEVASYTSLSYQSVSTITVGSNSQTFVQGGSTSFTMLGLNTNPRYYHNIGLQNGLYLSYNVLEAIQLSSTSQNSQYLSTVYANNSTASAYFNGTSKGSVTSVSGTSSYISLGYNGGTSYHNGNIQEVILYGTDKSSVRTSIESNIGDYFTQNTPLLDTYSGAAAAYSLRLLDSTYTGALINVWNGTSYADIYPNVFGELDTVALAAHCGSNDGFIRYWYDQSSNGNTATQTTTAAMPKIYDGTTGVVTDNGKPAVQNIDNTSSLKNTNSLNVKTAVIVTRKTTTSYNYRTFLGFSTETNSIAMAEGNISTQIFAFGDVYQNTVAFSSGANNYNTINDQNLYVIVKDTTVATGNVILGGRDTGFRVGAYIQEVVLWSVNQQTESNRSGIEDNINTFYNIY